MTSQPHSPQPQGEVQPQNPPSALTQLEKAGLILQSGKISFDPKLHLFNVLEAFRLVCDYPTEWTIDPLFLKYPSAYGCIHLWVYIFHVDVVLKDWVAPAW